MNFFFNSSVTPPSDNLIHSSVSDSELQQEE